MTVLLHAAPHLASPTSAPRYAFFGSLVRILAGGEETGGAYALTEHLLPPGAGAPPHIHHNEDEALYVLDGELTVWCGHNSYLARAGDFVYLPREVRHTFVNTGGGDARMLIVSTPAGLERFIAAAGEPTERDDAPPMPDDEDLGRILTRIAPQFGIELHVYL